MRWLSAKLRHLIRDQGGATSVEFVILVPIFLLVMVNSIEGSILMMRGALLDRGLDMAMRELRLSTGSPPSYDAFRGLVCRNAGLLGDCMSSLQVELRPIDLQAGAPLTTSARCVEGARDIVPLVETDPSHYAGGAVDQLTMVRACLLVKPVVPNLGLAALLPTDQGGFLLVSVSVFVQEPVDMAVGS
jgi:Flp pilus assembly pilin Flp